MTEQEIVDYLKQNREKGRAFDLMPEEVKQWCWAHQIEQNVIYDDTKHIRKEKLEMTEQEIITYLKENKNKGVAFAFMPVKVKQWCVEHKDMGIIFNVFEYGEEYGWWRKCNTICCCVNSIYCLDADYEPESQFKSDWQEFDIDENGCFEFEDKKYYYREDARFETENRDRFKGFGGWLYVDDEKPVWYTSPRVAVGDRLYPLALIDNESRPVMPTKIRFWRYRE